MKALPRPAMSRFRLPRFTQSIRFRLTVLYSLLLFALAGTALVVTYVAVERSTDPKPITQRYQAELVKRRADGRETTVGTIEVAAVEEIESVVGRGYRLREDG